MTERADELKKIFWEFDSLISENDTIKYMDAGRHFLKHKPDYFSAVQAMIDAEEDITPQLLEQAKKSLRFIVEQKNLEEIRVEAKAALQVIETMEKTHEKETV